MADAEAGRAVARFMIVPPAPQDAAAIARLSEQLGYPASAEQMHSRLELLAGQAAHWVRIARSGAGAVLGWIHAARCVTLEGGEYAEILGLVVGGEARRAGVGRELVAAAEEWSRNLGLERMTVRSNVLRSESHLFYPSLGYGRAKSQHVYVKPLARAGR